MNQGSIFVTVLARTRVLSRFANGGGEVFPNSKKCLRMRRYWLGRVAQLVRAPASHAGGHRFESCRAHHLLQRINRVALWCFWSIFGALRAQSRLYAKNGGNPDPKNS